MKRNLVLLGTVRACCLCLVLGCSPAAPPLAPQPSVFVRVCDFNHEFDTAARRAGIDLSKARVNNGGGSFNSSGDGKSGRDAELGCCGTSDQADALIRALREEVSRRASQSGATVQEESPAAQDSPVKEWGLSYIAGPQMGTIRARRSDDGGPCFDKGAIGVRIKIAWKEAPQ